MKANVDYDLPPLIKSVKDGWQQTCQSGAVVSGLLAGTAAQLLGFFKDDGNFSDSQKDSTARRFTLFLCYSSLFFNISATIGSFILIDRLGELAIRAQRKERPQGIISGCANLLQKFGAGSRRWTYILWHWLICFFLGIWSLSALILAYVWMSEIKTIQIVLTLVAAFAVLPHFIFLIPHFNTVTSHTPGSTLVLPIAMPQVEQSGDGGA